MYFACDFQYICMAYCLIKQLTLVLKIICNNLELHLNTQHPVVASLAPELAGPSLPRVECGGRAVCLSGWWCIEIL
jgi:hypothetical protein